MAFDLTSTVIATITGLSGLLAGIAAPKFARDGKKIDADLAREQANVAARAAQVTAAQQAEERLQAQIMTLWEKSESKIEALHSRSTQQIDALKERVSVQGDEIASLKADLKIVHYSESNLKLENASLKTDLGRMADARDALNFENEQQSLEIARLNGRVQELTQKNIEAEARLVTALASIGHQSTPGGP